MKTKKLTKIQRTIKEFAQALTETNDIEDKRKIINQLVYLITMEEDGFSEAHEAREVIAYAR